MSGCQHDLVIAPDANDGRFEHVKCAKCGDSKRRVSVAETARKSAEDLAATVRGEIEAFRAELAELRSKLPKALE